MNVLPLLMIPFAVGGLPKDAPKEEPKAPAEARLTSGENYEIENSADSRYEQLKAALDEKFDKMFRLKAELDAQNAETEKKWNEYYAMRNAYEKQLKRIISIWVMDSCR